MGIFKKIKNIVLRCDFFRTTQYFRYRGQPQYTTLTGGLFSILLIISFLAIFSSNIIQTINKSKITWNYGLIQQTSSQFSVSANVQTAAKFMFAVGINNINLNQGQRYFDIFLSQIESINGIDKQIPIQLIKCNRNSWQSAGENIIKAYDRVNFSNFLCPKNNSNFSISGTKSSQNYKYIKIEARLCNSSLSTRPCVNSSKIDQYLLNNANFNLNFYFVNTLINPSHPTPLSYYLQDRNYVPFNMVYGGLANIFMSSYSISTDQSISPFQDSYVLKGGIVNNVGQVIASKTFKDVLANVYIKKSSLSLNINREYVKLDTTLSYIGGLFGFLMLAFIFMSVYTEYSYQIQIGDNLYYDQNHEVFESKKFNFFYFICYCMYSILLFFGLDCNWKLMKKYSVCRQQIQKQFDISFLMKRIIFFQKCLKYLFQDHQLKGLHMHDKLTIKQAQQLRSYYRLREQYRGQTRQITDNQQSQNNQSHQMNATQNAISNHQDLPLQNISSQKINISKDKNKVFPLELIQSIQKKKSGHKKKNIKQMTSKIYKPNSQIEGKNTKLSNQQSLKVSNIDNFKSHISLLRKQSQSGNNLSKKIFEGVNSDLVRHILSHLQQKGQNDIKKQQNNIIIQQNENQFQIRISKRKNYEELQDREEKISKIDIISEKSQIQVKSSNKKDNFQYIQ